MTHPVQAFIRLIAGLTLVAGFALSAAGGEVAAGDSSAVRSVIQSQIDAFQDDDGATAYGFASPTIQQVFPTADTFMSMVRRLYQPVYRPQSVTFGSLTEGATGLQQKVYLTGPDGARYVALYTLQRQPDGTWKIESCVLLPDTSPTA